MKQKQLEETLRDLSRLPESAFNSVVLPHPGGPSSRVILKEEQQTVCVNCKMTGLRTHSLKQRLQRRANSRYPKCKISWTPHASL